MKDKTAHVDSFRGPLHLSLLTPREIEVMDYMIQGYSNKEIAEAAGISTGTVTSHITNIRAKLQILRKGRPALTAAYLATREAGPIEAGSIEIVFHEADSHTLGNVLSGDRRPKQLSPHEVKIMECVVQGQSNKEIAVTIGLTKMTVDRYISVIRGKLQALGKNRNALITAYLATRET